MRETEQGETKKRKEGMMPGEGGPRRGGGEAESDEANQRRRRSNAKQGSDQSSGRGVAV